MDKVDTIDKMKDMEEYRTFKKDRKPYLIFRCVKCEQYQYVKQTQKTKKCLRCGRNYQVMKIEKLESMEIVDGMTNAVERVKQLQNELALEREGKIPNLRGENDFIVASPIFDSKEHDQQPNHETDIEKRFLELIQELGRRYPEFPLYMIELRIKDYAIPEEKVILLLNKALKKGNLKKTSNQYYKISV